MRETRYAVMLNGQVAALADGTLCFSTSMTSARADMLKFVREWRGSRHHRNRTAVRHGDGRVAQWYELKVKGEIVGELRIVDLTEVAA